MMAAAMTHSAPCSSADDASPNSNCSNYSNSSSSAAAAMQQMIADELAAAADHHHQQQQQAEADDFEDYVTRLPKAEDFGLGGFQEVPPEVFDEAAAGGIWDHTVAWPPSPAMMLDSALQVVPL